ncbi:MAG TPA: hypothetical protein VFA59_16120 [Vicinamibacterales bacterium]|nr:hypothetical protein [Vicinamibacterales bacterium]
MIASISCLKRLAFDPELFVPNSRLFTTNPELFAASDSRLLATDPKLFLAHS